MKFKVGDKVKRKESMLVDAGWSSDCETMGKDPRGIFVVKDVRGNSINVGICNDYHWNDINFNLVTSNYKLKNPTHLVVWDEEARDPCEFFIDEKKAKEHIKKLSEKSDVKKDSIILVEIKSAQKVNVIKNVRLSGYKI